ncbi:MAG: hypothetical protein U9R22_08015 [Pseudomonadota bacterium]|nr:hypothetical protein [Pseudomonadota bacterium]
MAVAADDAALFGPAARRAEKAKPSSADFRGRIVIGKFDSDFPGLRRKKFFAIEKFGTSKIR